MSWDIFVMDLPAEARFLADIPKDFKGKPIGQRSEIINKITEVIPFANFSDPSWGFIETPDFVIEVNIGHDEEVESFQLRVRGNDTVIAAITAILQHLQLRAIDFNSETGFFEPEASAASLRQWRDFRNRITN